MTKVNEIYAQVREMTTQAIYLALDAAEQDYAATKALSTDDGELFEARINVYNAVLDQRGVA